MELLKSISNLAIATWHHITQNKLSILYLIIFLVVFYFIYGIVLLLNNRKYIEENWSQYKCKPYIMPFAGIFSNQSSLENFNDCLWINYRKAFTLLMKPFNYIATIITATLGDIVQKLNKFRHMASFIREVYQKMVAEVFEKLTTSMSTLQFYTEKFRNLLKKQFATFQLIYYYLETLRASFDSLFNGPLPVMLLFLMIFGILAIFLVVMCGLCAASIPFFSWFVACPICLICFEPNSLIKIDNNEYLEIDKIQLGDIIFPNQKVLGKLVFDLDYDYQVYQLEEGVLVSDSHLYYNSTDKNDVDIPIRIGDFKNNLEELKTKKLVCLATSDHLIYTANHKLGDYTEVSNKILDNEWNERVLDSLNRILDYKDFPIGNYYSYPSGFLEKIGEIEYLVDENSVELYDYKGTICSGNCIVWENNIWLRVANSKIAKKYIGSHGNIVYHTKTNSGIIKIGDVYFRDFLETNDRSVYDWWNNISPKYLKTISV